MEALASGGTWELVSAPTDTAVVGCRWVFTLKYRPDRAVAKDYTQTYGIDYFETFSPVVRMNSIKILVSIAITCHGYCSNCMLRTLSFMGIFRRKFIWSNPQTMLLRGEQKVVVSRRPYMDSNRVQGRGLRSQPF